MKDKRVARDILPLAKQYHQVEMFTVMDKSAFRAQKLVDKVLVFKLSWSEMIYEWFSSNFLEFSPAQTKNVTLLTVE